MNMHPTDSAAAPGCATLREMTAEQLLYFGQHRVVYLKAAMRGGELLFMLFGADGTPYVTVDSVETAVEMAAERGFQFVSIH
jgi:hypothetical protein